MRSRKDEKRSGVSWESYSSAAPALGINTPFVTALNPDDVLLGRGAPIINYEGNVRFRELVQTHKADYIGTGRHQTKDVIARQIVAEIGNRNGRFLRRIASSEQAQILGVPDGTTAWLVAHETVAIEKVKQALRDKDPAKTMGPEPVLGSYDSIHQRPSTPAMSAMYAQANPSMLWLRGASSLIGRVHNYNAPTGNPGFSAFALPRQEDSGQQPALPNQQLLEHQYVALLQEQHQQIRNQTLAALRMASRGASLHDPTIDELSALWGRSSTHLHESFAPTTTQQGLVRALADQVIQHEALAAQRDQQMLNQHHELLMRSECLFEARMSVQRDLARELQRQADREAQQADREAQQADALVMATSTLPAAASVGAHVAHAV
jgi:hypothetical protein